MEFDEVLLGRRSIRGYKPASVPKALIKEILTIAMRSPSSMNTQPWNFTVVSGEVLNRIRAGDRTPVVRAMRDVRFPGNGKPLGFQTVHTQRPRRYLNAAGIEKGVFVPGILGAGIAHVPKPRR